MFKLALNAGHYSGTTKGIPAALSPTGKHMDEWTLNDRVCDRMEALLAGFDGVEILRLDDTTGKTDVPLEARTDAANAWGADFYLSVHHNAGIGGGSGGGMVAYVYTHVGDETLAWQKDLYDALIAATGLRGNRSQPLAKADLHEVRETNMSAVLLELGFMDSIRDVQVILADDFADKCAAAIVDVIARRAGLTKKPEPEVPVATGGKLYRIQVGAFGGKSGAESMRDKVKAAGFPVYIISVGGMYKLFVGSYQDKNQAAERLREVTAAGFNAFITAEDLPVEPEVTDPAKSFDRSVAGTYTVTAAALNIRTGASTNKSIMVTIPKGTHVKNFGYYTVCNGDKWLYVQFTHEGATYNGFAHSDYLQKV